MAKATKPRTYTATAKQRLRRLLHSQLDALLNGDTVEGGATISVLDSMVLRALQGFGFNVRVHSLHPDQTTKVEAPGTVAPGPAVGLVRDGA
jgi:hypothetical protein